MKKIKLYIAASIDGYIAGPNGDMDWLIEFPFTPKENHQYDNFTETVDTVLMGGRTYLEIITMPIVWPYDDKKTYIVTRNTMLKNNKGYQYITKDVVGTVARLKEGTGKDIWLVGGGELIALLLKNDLIDEMTINYIPITLGTGTRLFQDCSKEYNWTLKDTKTFPENISQISYIRSKIGSPKKAYFMFM